MLRGLALREILISRSIRVLWAFLFETDCLDVPFDIAECANIVAARAIVFKMWFTTAIAWQRRMLM